MPLRLNWSGGYTAPAEPVNVVHVQGMGGEVFMSFGHAPAPLAIVNMSDEQMAEYLDEHGVAVQQISRFTLSVDTARTLQKGLQEILDKAPPPA
jgi:hypothetical protein